MNKLIDDLRAELLQREAQLKQPEADAAAEASEKEEPRGEEESLAALENEETELKKRMAAMRAALGKK